MLNINILVLSEFLFKTKGFSNAPKVHGEIKVK